jgi:hypothetical protein
MERACRNNSQIESGQVSVLRRKRSASAVAEAQRAIIIIPPRVQVADVGQADGKLGAGDECDKQLALDAHEPRWLKSRPKVAVAELTEVIGAPRVCAVHAR